MVHAGRTISVCEEAEWYCPTVKAIKASCKLCSRERGVDCILLLIEGVSEKRKV